MSDVNFASVILSALGQKPNCTITTVTSVTGNVINGQTINIEYSSDEDELVAKTFSTIESIVAGTKAMAETDGHPASMADWVEKRK